MVGSRNTPRDVPNKLDRNEVEDTDDSDTDSVAGFGRQEDTVSVVKDSADTAMPRANFEARIQEHGRCGRWNASFR